MTIKTPKKLIEVALPLDDINVAAAREKSIRHGHPSTLHIWWARRPLAAARAVIFAQMVNDPGGERGYFAGKTKAQADREREVLFDIIRDLVKWENTTNERVLERAREAIQKSWRETCELNKKHPQAAELFNPDKLPAFHDPFAGGGAIPLEAQRLGLEAYASDLNPVAVTINKAMIEIPPKFSGQIPVGPTASVEEQTSMYEDWSGAKGLAEDVRRYGLWMKAEAEKSIGHLYPQFSVTASVAQDRSDLKPYVGQQLTVIAWLWVRTVKSPNPAYSKIDVPLATTFVLSGKAGKEAYVEPIIEDDQYRFSVKVGKPPEVINEGTTAGKRKAFRCLFSNSPIDYNHIRSEGKAGRMGQRLMAVIANGPLGRVYLPPTIEQIEAAESARPDWSPGMDLPNNPRDFKTPNYGLTKFSDLFTSRQLVALATFSDLVPITMEKARIDAINAGITDDNIGLDAGGRGATAYAQAVGTYLSFAVDYATNYWSTITTPAEGFIRGTFSRQALPMTWDFAEAPPFGSTSGNWMAGIEWISKALSFLPGSNSGFAMQADAAAQKISSGKLISTDPPYYDNIGYADLSDFFYVWQRKTLRPIFPGLYATLAVPKAEELVATPYRHGGKIQAENFFLNGMTRAIQNLVDQAHPAFPITIYYAFKQSETKENSGTASTGWETFLEAILRAGFAINGTWPMRTERGARSIGIGSNALASSIILVCSKRESIATISRRDFQRELREQMPEALEVMIGGQAGATPIAPVDLAQAAIGPGMAIFSKYAGVLEADGTTMSVHSALIMINKEITDFLTPDAGNYDADTLFCSAWFDQFGWSKGAFGEADVLARGKGTSVDGVKDAGVIESGGGKVRLLKWQEYPADWDPETDNRTPVWESLHQLIRVLNQKGESDAGALLARMPERAEQIRQLAYHLYTLCERKKWAEEARAYNELITSWHGIVTASQDAGVKGTQADFEF